jgi:protein SCO1/2
VAAAPPIAPLNPRATTALAVLTLGLLGGLVWMQWGRTRAAELPRLFPVPSFNLVERSGRPATLAGLRGHPWVADFIFTRCGGACPAMTARLAALRTRLAGTPVRFVSFSVDPVNDTPAVLARYAADVKAGEEWWFVTGPVKELHALSVDGFKLAAMEAPPGSPGPDGPFLHSSKFVLMDGDGWIRGYYDSEDEEAVRALEADARRLAVPGR